MNLPVRQSGSDQPYQIYTKPPQSLISGKNPKIMVTSPTLGTSQQLREIFESDQKEKFSFESKAKALE